MIDLEEISKIRESLLDFKVDSSLSHCVNNYFDNKNSNLNEKVPVLIKGSNSNLSFKDQLSKIGNVYSLRVSYKELPNLISNKDVLKIDLSRGVD